MATYKPLQSSTLTTTATSFTFSGIDQNYTDLVFVYRGQAADATNNMYLRFNGSSASYYSTTLLVGNGSAASSTRFSNSSAIVPDYFGGNVNNSEKTYQFHIANYSNTTTYKTTICKTSIPDKEVVTAAGLWRGSTGSSTEAITSVTLLPGGGSFAAGSTFDLYGIKSGAPQALGGDVVTTDGNYWYHTFRSTQIFTTQRPLTVDYLVVAGGGGGGYGHGGGGGGGGLRSTLTRTGGNAVGVNLESPLFLPPSTYTVTVGAGGAAGATTSLRASNGSDSIFSTVTSTGGGGGGSRLTETTGAVGGSGGGGSLGATGGAGTSNQGFAGGGSVSTNPGSGGGGAGAVGSTAITIAGVGANGGAGVSSSLSGSSVGYAGGGGGGSNGGGGTSTNGSATDGGGGGGTTVGTAGTANLGGGGGGGAFANNVQQLGAAGGSGIVIVRYAV